ncbi:hypothetical protein [Undibacterium sp. RuTC16W]|uniref:hypothetical protein n=1 Tax=Undibacterium sp. RuTC16W TaxID=3413048 RepID=UPI003BF060B5
MTHLRKSKWFLLFLIIPIFVIAATTWGPVSVALFGGNNRNISASEDEELGHPGAGAAMRTVLLPAYLSGKLKPKDRIVFVYADGTKVTKVYMGNFQFTVPALENLSSYLDNIRNTVSCSGNQNLTSSYLNVTGHWESVTGSVSVDGGSPTYTTADFWVADSLGSFPNYLSRGPYCAQTSLDL